MSEIRVDSIGTESNTGGPVLSGITTFSGQQYFIPPKGTTAERPSDCPPGSIRFNPDSAHLEYWNGLSWLEFEASSEELGGVLTGTATTFSTNGSGTRAFIAGGLDPGVAARIDFITINTFGNSQDFGDLAGSRQRAGAVASRTRGLVAGGFAPGFVDTILKLEIASTGSTGNTGSTLTQSKNRLHGCGNQTRGIFAWGNPSSNVIEYVTIATEGDAVDFGDTSYAAEGGTSVANPVRAVFAGGHTPGSPSTERDGIQFVTISSTGNGQDFGSLSSTPLQPAGISKSTRGIFAGGDASPNVLNTIEFVTIATTGNTTDFGELTGTRFDMTGSSNQTRGVICGGSAPGLTGIIDSLEIASTGNAVDFGDMDKATMANATSSNGHGGL